MFPAIVMPSTRKIRVPTPDGIEEYVLTRWVKTGIWVFEKKGFYAQPIREAEIWERQEAYDALKLPKVGGIVTLRTKSWFCLPINDNQWEKHVKFNVPIPLLFPSEDLSVFDFVKARIFKGRRTFLLYEDIYPLATPDKMRTKLAEVTRTTDIDSFSSALTYPREVRRAFRIVADQYIPPLERLVKEALRIVNAKFIALKDEGRGIYRIHYEYKSRQDSVTVNESLICLDSGICLSGRDTDFGLSSVILVKSRRY